jgi:hypothetical protein
MSREQMSLLVAAVALVVLPGGSIGTYLQRPTVSG